MCSSFFVSLSVHYHHTIHLASMHCMNCCPPILYEQYKKNRRTIYGVYAFVALVALVLACLDVGLVSLWIGILLGVLHFLGILFYLFGPENTSSNLECSVACCVLLPNFVFLCVWVSAVVIVARDEEDMMMGGGIVINVVYLVLSIMCMLRTDDMKEPPSIRGGPFQLVERTEHAERAELTDPGARSDGR